MTQPDMASLIDRLGQAAKECRDLVRQMHEAQKDLKSTIKDAKVAKLIVQEAIEETLSAVFLEEIKAYLDRQLLQALKEMTDANDVIMSNLTRQSTEMTKLLQDTIDRMAELNKRYDKKIEGIQ